MRYEWDDEKNEINEKKHGISFSDATTVFDDDEALFMNDLDHLRRMFSPSCKAPECVDAVASASRHACRQTVW